MDAPEIAGHTRRRWLQLNESRAYERRLRGFGSETWPPSRDPIPLPLPADAPDGLAQALRIEARRLMRGDWLAFGGIPLRVDMPPRWHKDYFAGVDLDTREPGRRLNHRSLPSGADIKFIWELSRWSALVSLAQTSFLTQDPAAARTCLSCLADWDSKNPAFLGWNWTSALEAGIRLVQFVVIDELLATWISSATNGTEANAVECSEELQRLRQSILPRHVWMVWRYRSFGSSANNHLLGELAGLILAIARWPRLDSFAVPLQELHQAWELEVLRQFAEDGGNKEQALNYQLFAWEFCWITFQALDQAGIVVSDAVVERLERAAGFFAAVWMPGGWDFGDSDSAWVVPWHLPGATAAEAWHRWFRNPARSSELDFWLKPGLTSSTRPLNLLADASKPLSAKCLWRIFEHSGIGFARVGDWFLRWDLSPLGYLKTAAHGHLDALHLSIWFDGKPVVIDPGTGAYYGDERLRSHLAGWGSHNGPVPRANPPPDRLGPFLWSRHHPTPRVTKVNLEGVQAELQHPSGVARRSIRAEAHRVVIEDAYEATQESDPAEFSVRWQFPPGAVLDRGEGREFRVSIEGVDVVVKLSASWSEISCVNPSRGTPGHPSSGDLQGVCSSRFREARFGPFLHLSGVGVKSGIFETSFEIVPGTRASASPNH